MTKGLHLYIYNEINLYTHMSCKIEKVKESKRNNTYICHARIL